MIDKKILEEALDELEEAAYDHGWEKADGRHGRNASDERYKARMKVLSLIFKENKTYENCLKSRNRYDF